MTKEEAIKLLSQTMDALLASNSWLPSTDNPIKESFGMAISALQAQENCNNLTTDIISRKAALNAISTFGNREYRRKQGTLRDAYKLISALPTASKSGHWIHDTHYGLNLPEHKCSECGTWEYSDEESNFCPNCGADMRGEKDD